MRRNSLGSHQSFVDGGTLGREYSQGEWIAREDSQRSERFGDALTQKTALGFIFMISLFWVIWTICSQKSDQYEQIIISCNF